MMKAAWISPFRKALPISAKEENFKASKRVPFPSREAPSRMGQAKLETTGI